MRLFVHYEPSPAGVAAGAAAQHTMKATLPASWDASPVSRVLALFLDAYDKKHGSALAGAAGAWALAAPGGAPLPLDALVGAACRADDDLRVRHVSDAAAGAGSGAGAAAAEGTAPPPSGAAAAPPAASSPLVPCRNYGCMQKFDPAADGGDAACAHHRGPPCFNDVRKWWSCCKDRVAYDWDEFTALEKCARGRHSTTDPGASLAPSPRVAAAAAAAGTAAAAAAGASAAPQSIEAWGAANATAATAAGGVARTLSTRPRARRAPGGVAGAGGAGDAWVCVAKGCGAAFSDAANGPGACRHHVGAPVFHDRLKYWSCCPAHKTDDFDEFTKVPGCAVGPHDAGDREGVA